ncbi:MAG: FAD-binding protein [Sinobacteraceae bacterium]|nr:FAD-binding protein [Nevskiaceae bacterium]
MAQPEVFDFVVVGSGGGGLAGALTAAAAGASVVVLEKTPLIGGSTAMSGGVLWIPNSQPAERAGVQDSFDEGMRYFQSVVGEAGPASSAARRTAFLEKGRAMLEFLERLGLTFQFCDGYADYYDDRPGGKARGRVLKAAMLPSKQLGELYSQLRQFEGWTAPVNTDEFSALTLVKRAWKGRFTALKVLARSAYERLTRQRLLCRGAALQGRMLLLTAQHNIPIRTGSAVVDFVTEAGRVRGVRVRTQAGEEIEVRANKGVLLDSGGFARNAEMRKRYHPQPSLPSWSASNPGDTGELIERAKALGAATDMLDEAIWIPVSLMPDGQLGGFHNPHDMAKPFSIMVDQKGRRYCNEAASYMEIGQAMYRTGAVPSWIILDRRHRSYYSWGAAAPGMTPPEWLKNGYMKTAGSISELARACGLDAATFGETILRFNSFAKRGVDEDFGRGARMYDRFYGDPTHGPNPGLGSIEKAPFYAVQVYPGDVGTFGGLLTNEHGAVLRPDGSQIDGLYATGNGTASVMGRTYPGAGASIAASFIFGYAGAQHALSGDRSSPGSRLPRGEPTVAV